MDAELAYLFRHGLIRDAAYELQPPGTRAILHGTALMLLEEVFGGRPDWPDLVAQPRRYACDAVAEELAFHAARAQAGDNATSSAAAETEARYLWRAASYAEYRGEPLRAIQYFEALAGHAAAPLFMRGIGSRSAGWLLHTVGQTSRGRTLVERALAHAADEGLEIEISRAQGVLGQLLSDTGDFRQAVEHLEHALATQRVAGLRGDESRTLTALANACGHIGRNKEGVSMLRRAVELAREDGSLRAEGVALANLGAALVGEGELDEAQQVYLRALAVQREIGNRRIEGIVLGNLANLLHRRGDSTRAEQYFVQALALHRANGNLKSEGFVTGNLATLYADTERSDLAAQAFEFALASHQKVGAKWALAVHRCDYGVFLLKQGRAETGRETWLLGAKWLHETGDKKELAEKLSIMRKACYAAGVGAFDPGW